VSGPVDVLAVLRAARDSVPAEQLLDYCAAVAALAELIAADLEYDEAKAEQDDNAKFDETGMYVPRAVFERVEAATARRADALASVGGES